MMSCEFQVVVESCDLRVAGSASQAKMKGIFVLLVALCFATTIQGPLHASCKINW